MITVSSNAKEYISRLLAEEHKDAAAFVRVGIKAGGCSGLEYKMSFDTETKDGDHIFEDKGIKVVVDMKSLLYLYGTELDYSLINYEPPDFWLKQKQKNERDKSKIE